MVFIDLSSLSTISINIVGIIRNLILSRVPQSTDFGTLFREPCQVLSGEILGGGRQPPSVLQVPFD